MNISLTYSSIAFLLSPEAGTYLITTVWSGCFNETLPFDSNNLEFSKISEIHSDFDVYFDLNCLSEDRFLPSLFPK